MTIEDLPEPSLEGDSLNRRNPFLFPGSETSVTFSVAAAPMPSDCGMYIYWKQEAILRANAVADLRRKQS